LSTIVDNLSFICFTKKQIISTLAILQDKQK